MKILMKILVAGLLLLGANLYALESMSIIADGGACLYSDAVGYDVSLGAKLSLFDLLGSDALPELKTGLILNVFGASMDVANDFGFGAGILAEYELALMDEKLLVSPGAVIGLSYLSVERVGIGTSKQMGFAFKPQVALAYSLSEDMAAGLTVGYNLGFYDSMLTSVYAGLNFSYKISFSPKVDEPEDEINDSAPIVIENEESLSGGEE